MTHDNFHYFVGKLFMFCQCIEHDIKWIYAKMLKGNKEDNFRIVENKTLGTIIGMLKTLDYSDDDHWFSESDYALLKDITAIRNYWAHRAYIEYVYGGDNIDILFDKISRRLSNDCNRLEKLQESIESIRLRHYQEI